MRFLPTAALPEVVVVESDVHRDDRGSLIETWNAVRFREAGIDAVFVQENLVHSARGVLRGLHAQRKRPQGKLVRAVRGEVLDVAVDVRRGSPTYLKWVGETLSEKSARSLWVPPGFAHGYCVLGDSADVSYLVTGAYDAADEIRIAWNDPDIGIRWPTTNPVLSDKDRTAPRARNSV